MKDCKNKIHGCQELTKSGGQVVMMCAAAAERRFLFCQSMGGGGAIATPAPTLFIDAPETQYKMADLVKRILTLNFLYHSLLL